MVWGIGSDNQFAGHKGVKVSAGLGAAIGEFAWFFSRKFDFFNLVPVGLEVAVLILPVIL
jgi:hypothetical protein